LPAVVESLAVVVELLDRTLQDMEVALAVVVVLPAIPDLADMA
jgi:hypothetical protein